MKDNKLVKNIVIGFGAQAIALILGIIVPRFILDSYGSDTNGILSTVTQIFSYLALLEAGVSQSAQMALYKPIVEKDEEQINVVLSSANAYFRKLTIPYGFGVILLAMILPFVLKTDLAKETIIGIVLLEGISEVCNFYFIQVRSCLLGILGKSYINNGITLLSRILIYMIKIVLACMHANILLLQLGFVLIAFIKIIIYCMYIKRKYPRVQFHGYNKQYKLKDRNSYVLSEIAWTVFSSTDMIVLSIFLNAKMSSVYSVYNMIFSSVNALVSAVYYSVCYVLGYAYHENIEKYKRTHDSFMSAFVGTMTILISIAYVLTIPFVKLYTQGIRDVEYIYPLLPLLFCLVQLLSWSRFVSGNLTSLAGYAKQTSYISFMEAIINIVLSVTLVNRFGISGVVAATVTALPVKVIWCNYIADKKVMHRSIKKTVLILGANYALFFGIVMINHFYQPGIDSFPGFFKWGVILTLMISTVGVGLNCLVNRELVLTMGNILKIHKKQ